MEFLPTTISLLYTMQVAYVGDSEADEYAISRLKGVAYTFRVINEDATVITRTSANYRLEGKYFSVKSKLQKKILVCIFP